MKHEGRVCGLRYQDYVIKDGQFIGKFEEMYKAHENPWYQVEHAETSYSRIDAVNSIRRFKLKNVLEVGCGLGYYTNFLATECSDTKITGMDVSETAIQKAREKWSQLSFFAGNIKDQNDVWEDGLYDAVLFAEILWYVLEDIEEIKIKANKFLSSGGGTSC